MDLTIISTFRCDSRCQMCYIWQNPTHPKEELSLDTISKLPGGFDNLNVSGGEPTVRRDLAESRVWRQRFFQQAIWAGGDSLPRCWSGY